jgi:hypothetical protein
VQAARIVVVVHPRAGLVEITTAAAAVVAVLVSAYAVWISSFRRPRVVVRPLSSNPAGYVQPSAGTGIGGGISAPDTAEAVVGVLVVNLGAQATMMRLMRVDLMRLTSSGDLPFGPAVYIHQGEGILMPGEPHQFNLVTRPPVTGWPGDGRGGPLYDPSGMLASLPKEAAVEARINWEYPKARSFWPWRRNRVAYAEQHLDLHLSIAAFRDALVRVQDYNRRAEDVGRER